MRALADFYDSRLPYMKTRWFLQRPNTSLPEVTIDLRQFPDFINDDPKTKNPACSGVF
jgi:hypothetical protein